MKETEIREAWMKETWITEYHDRKDIADWWLALRAKELGQLRDGMKKLKRKYSNDLSLDENTLIHKLESIDDTEVLLDELIEKP